MKEFYLFDSYTQKKTKFEPVRENEAAIYVCGPTVYASPHIGNFRPPVVFDVLRRTLLAIGYKVTFVSNYTDVDDKIINEARALGISEAELSSSIIKEYKALSDELGIMPPDYTPTPTSCMGKIISYIKDLVDEGYAYEVDGDVYFRVRKIEGYGSLSGNSIEALEEGARIEISDKKEDPLDFALWKKTEVGIKWASPWSIGRPGWHSECCVMINDIFSYREGYIDIHGGGFDLKFPHHENEMAQSLAHNGNRLAKYWMHNGFINIGKEKMSKSLGNVTLMKDVVSSYGGMAFRLALLSSYYRAPVSYSEELLLDSKKKWEGISSSMRKGAIRLLQNDIDPYTGEIDLEGHFMQALLDDLNTPNALSALYEENKALNVALRNPGLPLGELRAIYNRLYLHLGVLGLIIEKISLSGDDKLLLRQYEEARSKKDYASSDILRAKLLEKGLL